MVNRTAQVIAADDGPKTQIRTGVVSAATASEVTILVGATSFIAAYFEPYVPQAGDLVGVLRQDSTWSVLGKVAGSGANLVTNFSFEDDLSGSFPTNWILYDISQTSSAVVTQSPDAPDGLNVASVSTSSTTLAESFLYSAPIYVSAGDIFNVSAYVGAQYGLEDTPTADAALFALWFANDTNLYPTTSSADTSIATATDVAQAPPFTTLSGQVTAPVGGIMRVALRSAVLGDQALQYDFVIARKVS